MKQLKGWPDYFAGVRDDYTMEIPQGTHKCSVHQDFPDSPSDNWGNAARAAYVGYFLLTLRSEDQLLDNIKAVRKCIDDRVEIVKSWVDLVKNPFDPFD